MGARRIGSLILALGLVVLAWDISPGGRGVRAEALEFAREIALPPDTPENCRAIESDLSGRRIVLNHPNGLVHVIDGQRGECLLRIGPTPQATAVAVDPMGRWVAVGAHDGRVRFFVPPQAEPVAVAPPEALSPQEIAAVAASPTGRMVAVVSADGQVFVLTAPGGRLLAQASLARPRVPRPGSGISIAFSKREHEIFLASPYRFAAWLEIDSSELRVREFPGEVPPQAAPVAASPDGRTVAIAGTGIQILDMERGTVAASLECRPAPFALAFLAQGQLLAAAAEWELWLWDTSRWNRRRVLRVLSPLAMGRPASAAGVGWIITAQDAHPRLPSQGVPARPARLYLWAPGRPATGRAFLGVSFSGNASAIAAVLPDTAAERAGLRPGDTILAIGGTPISSYPDVRARMGELRSGDVVVLRIRRGTEEQEVEVRLDALPPGGPPE